MTQTVEQRKAKGRERAAAWLQQPGNTEKSRARAKAWYEANKERSAEYTRQWQARNPEIWRATRIKSKYKLTDEQYERILSHSGECDACGSTDQPTQIDHDHETGAYRGQPCGGCNRAAGHLGDDADRALALYHYLKERQKA